jgi:hypothetical protein
LTRARQIDERRARVHATQACDINHVGENLLRLTAARGAPQRLLGRQLVASTAGLKRKPENAAVRLRDARRRVGARVCAPSGSARLQQVFFADGIRFDGKKLVGTGTTLPVFNYLSPDSELKKELVDQTGIEPVTS